MGPNSIPVSHNALVAPSIHLDLVLRDCLSGMRLIGPEVDDVFIAAIQLSVTQRICSASVRSHLHHGDKRTLSAGGGGCLRTPMPSRAATSWDPVQNDAADGPHLGATLLDFMV